MKTAAMISVKAGAIPPLRKYVGDAGLDLALQSDEVIPPGSTKYILSGVSFDLPPGLCVHIMTRSSTFKRGVIVVPTIIDQSYKSECSIIVTNNSDKPVELKRGERLAQAVLMPFLEFYNELIAVEHRAYDQGLGSSGL